MPEPLAAPPGDEPRVVVFNAAQEMAFLSARRAEAEGNREKAIELYQKALSYDPRHIESFHALGRLRYTAPVTPYLDTVREQLNTQIVPVNIQVRNPCNYRCFYCVGKGHNADPVQEFDLDRVQAFFRLLQRRPNSLIVSNLECGGGEPTVHPQFPELIRLISQFGPVCFPSNNSQNPERWLPRENATNLLITSAFHPEAEETIERYFRYARFLLDAGVLFHTTFICHPTRIHKAAKYKDLFATNNIPFTAISFVGEYEGRAYPAAHTEEEKKIMGLDQTGPDWMYRIDPHVSKNRNFRGIPCIAGYQSFYLTNKGVMTRCNYDLRPMQHMNSRAEPCQVNRCGCGLWLEKLNLTDTGDMHNTFTRMPGTGLTPVNLAAIAARFGHASANEAVLQEQTAVYNALMQAYGKNEFQEKD